MQIVKNFDAKIRVVYPYITKGISDSDSERINRNTLMKYEPQKTIVSPTSISATEKPVAQEERVKDLMKSLHTTHKKMGQLKKIGKKGIENVVYEYDVDDLDNEMLGDAEESLFGAATGKITFAKYQRALAYSRLIDAEIRRRTVANGGSLVRSA